MIMEQQAYGYNFELGRGKNYSVNEIAEAFNINPIYKNNKPGEAQDTLNTDTTANDVLGWNPTKDVLDYIHKLKL
jgi:nucleoside-diphosphate-sugar epimerase